jgi:hypothetical protein
MHKPRELTPRPRNFAPAGVRKEPGTAKPEVQPAADNDQEASQERATDKQDAK